MFFSHVAFSKNLSYFQVVVRKLHPSLQKSDFTEILETLAAGKYNWLAFVPGKTRYCTRFQLDKHHKVFSFILSLLFLLLEINVGSVCFVIGA